MIAELFASSGHVVATMVSVNQRMIHVVLFFPALLVIIVAIVLASVALV